MDPIRRPSSQFYWADHLRDTALRMCSLAARGLWMDLQCFMHDCVPYGHLMVNGEAITDPGEIGRIVGEGGEVVAKCLGELERFGVLKRTEAGCYYSKRMVKDEAKRNGAVEAGKEGGNPSLGGDYHQPGYIYFARRASGPVKIGISKDPSKRMYKLRQEFKGESVELAGRAAVADMAAELDKFRAKYAAKAIEGDWFALSGDEITLALRLMEKSQGEAKANPTPSSSTPSSSEEHKDIGARAPYCPVADIVDAYRRCAPSLIQPRIVTDAVKAQIAARWRQDAKHQHLEFWKRLFEYCEASDFLAGREEGRGGAKPFRAGLEWIVKSANFAKIINGNYHHEETS